MKEPILISACLMGSNCKYNGGSNYTPLVEELKKRYELIPVCPECLGGLPCPRSPAERVGQRVITKSGQDVTEYFQNGAKKTLEIARRHGVLLAVFKERSPSCGCGVIYDGSFSGVSVPGNGVAAEALLSSGVAVYGESRIHELLP